MNVRVRLALVFLVALTTACGGIKRPTPEADLSFTANEVVAAIQSALLTVDEAPEWAKLKADYAAAKTNCDGVKAGASSILCVDSAPLAARCKCLATADCAQKDAEICGALLSASSSLCPGINEDVSESYECRLARSKRVPQLTHAEITLQVAKTVEGGGKFNVILFSAGANRSTANTQTLKFKLSPNPKASAEGADSNADRNKNLQISLRKSIVEMVGAALSVASMSEVEIQPDNADEPRIVPLELHANEFSVSAEIVRKGANELGLGWASGDGSLGASVGGKSSNANTNQLTLYFSQGK